MHSQNWMIEFRDNRSNMYRLVRTEVSTTSQYQEILLADVQGFGRALFLDGVPQSSALDEHIYHEVLVHPALAAHKQPRTVFLAGGGEGATLRETLKHLTVERVVMVEIDQVLTDLAKTYLKDWHQGAFDDKRVEVVNEDARRYLEKSPETFDCIMLDLTDPFVDGLSTPLFTAEFFMLAKAHLSEDGILALQAETVDYGSCKAHVAIIKTLQNCFQSVLPYQVFLPFYGLPWGFAVASDLQNLCQRLSPYNVRQTLLDHGCSDLRFYDSETHEHMFSLPKYLRNAIADATALVSDRQPLALPRPSAPF